MVSKKTNCVLVGYSDYDFADCKLDRKGSVECYPFLVILSFLGIVKKTSCILSTSGAKYAFKDNYFARVIIWM